MPGCSQSYKIQESNTDRCRLDNIRVDRLGDRDGIFDYLLLEQEGIVSSYSKGYITADVLSGQ